MYKGTPDKNPGVSAKNDETMKAPGQGNGPAQMQKPGDQSGQQRESGQAPSKNPGGRVTGTGNGNSGTMSREAPGSETQSQNCPGSGSHDTPGGHSGSAQGQDQMSQRPAGHEPGLTSGDCPCMKSSDKQQGAGNGPAEKGDREFSCKGSQAPEGSRNGQREAPANGPGNQQMGPGSMGHETGPNGGGCPCMKNSDNQQGPENGPAEKADRQFSGKGRWASEESGNGPRGGAINQDRANQGPDSKDTEAFHHRFSNAGKHERFGCGCWNE